MASIIEVSFPQVVKDFAIPHTRRVPVTIDEIEIPRMIERRQILATALEQY
jgi:hypothetical protein